MTVSKATGAKGGGVKRKGDDGPSLESLRNQLEAYMDQRGLRSTSQRRIVTDTFFRAEGHYSIEELLALVRKKDPRVGYATVYRTLKMLAEGGLANERQFGDGVTRYELAQGEHHDHLICVYCGKIVEFEEDRIEKLQEQVAKRYGFIVQSHKHELYGVCGDCQTSGRTIRT